MGHGVTVTVSDAVPGSSAVCARTRHSYVFLFVSPSAVCSVVAAPLDEMSVQPVGSFAVVSQQRYCHFVMSELLGSVQLSAASPSPATADRPVGLAGPAMGVTLTDAAALAPAEFLARSSKLYDVPLVRFDESV